MLDVRLESGMDGLQNGLPRLAFLDVPVYPILDEDLFQRGEMPGFLKFAEADFQLPAQQHAGAVRAPLQDLLDTQEDRLVVLDDTGIRGDADFAVREGVEGIDGPVRADAVGQVNDDLDLFGRIVLHPLDLDLALSLAFRMLSMREVVVSHTAPPRR